MVAEKYPFFLRRTRRLEEEEEEKKRKRNETDSGRRKPVGARAARKAKNSIEQAGVGCIDRPRNEKNEKNEEGRRRNGTE